MDKVTRGVIWVLSFVVFNYLVAALVFWLGLGCRGEGCLVLVIPMLFALLSNIAVFVVGYGILVWFYLKGCRPMMPIVLGLGGGFALFIVAVLLFFGRNA